MESGQVERITTERTIMNLSPIVQYVDAILTQAGIKDTAKRRNMREYVIACAAYDAGLFYTSKLELATHFDERTLIFLNKIVDTIRDELYRIGMQQLGSNYLSIHEYELESATLELGILRMVLERKYH